MTSFSRISCLNVCTDSCATFESLNTGSLEIGAERKGQFNLGYGSGSSGSFVVLNPILFGLLRMEFLMGLLESKAGNSGMFIDGNIISIQELDLNHEASYPSDVTRTSRCIPRLIYIV